MKQSVLVRLANESYHSTIIELDVSKLTNVVKFPNEVFGTIDGVRVAILREEYDQAYKNIREHLLTEMMQQDQELGLYNIEEKQNGKETNTGTEARTSVD
jgi:hypothetical protein